jgi:hypothetical protein
MSVEHKSLRDEVLFVIGRASEPLDSGKIYERCELADEMKQVSNAIFQLKAAGKIVNAEGEGRARYVLASGTSAPAPAGKAGRPAAEIPVLGTHAEKPKADPVAAGLDLVERAVDKLIAAPSAVRPEPVEVRQSAGSLADAMLDRTRKQLARPAVRPVRWWIDQNGGIEILDDGEALSIDPVQTERMARLVMAFHDALEDV